MLNIMELIQKYITNRLFIVFVCFILFLLSSCTNEDDYTGFDGNEYTNVTVRPRTTLYSVNADDVFWEDRVDELRMIAFDNETGETVFNKKLNFPTGFSNKSEAIQLALDTYDFYFIANESVYPGDFVTAITGIHNKSEFTTDVRFMQIAYNSGFLPDENSQSGRFLMSAVYDDIAVTGGGTESQPLPLSLPTQEVELIRSLAKVEVVFRKKVSGSAVPANTISAVQLMNVASDISVPPYDNYYTGERGASDLASLAELNYEQDSMGTVMFYIPEFLVPVNGTDYTQLKINDLLFPILSDDTMEGIAAQRRTVPSVSTNSIIRNYHYLINAYVDTDGNVEVRVYVDPWTVDKYGFIFEGDLCVVTTPVTLTDSSITIPTDCGKVEILSHNESLSQGLQGAYHDTIVYWDPTIQGSIIRRGNPPFYCERKYGPGWRLMNSCEFMSFLALFDDAYKIWMSNTWDARDYNLRDPNDTIPYYSVLFRQTAQDLLERLTGEDLSGTVMYEQNNWEDTMDDNKLGIIDRYFTPGDIVVKEEDYPDGWPYPAPPGTNSSEKWYYNESVIQIRAFWYDYGYLDATDRSNWNNILYGHEFVRYDYSSTVCRCVRPVE